MKSKKTKNILVAIVLILLGVLVFFLISNGSKDGVPTQTSSENSVMSSSHPLNATYNIEGVDVTLVNGQSEVPMPNSSSTVVTSVWGEPLNEDIQGGTQEFWAVVINQVPGGSGSFYYISSCVGGGSSCTGTNAILLGDRIAMQTVEIESDGTIIVNYADRSANAPMTEQPSIGVTRRFTVIDNVLKEVLGS